MTSARTYNTTTERPAPPQSLGNFVATTLRGRINDGVYPPGSLLPSRRVLCTELGVAVLTLDRAIKLLMAEGILRSEPRKGTYVTQLNRTATGLGSSRAVEIPSRRPWLLGNRRIGIIDISDDVLRMRPDTSWTVYMIVHAAEDQICHMSSRITYPASYVPDDTPNNYVTMIQRMAAQGMDSLIVVAYNERSWAFQQTIETATQLGIPQVIVSSSAPDGKSPIVLTDNQLAGQSAAEHLLSSGYRRLIYLAPFVDHAWQNQRMEGLKQALVSAGRSASDLVVERSTEAERLFVEESDLCSALAHRALAKAEVNDAVVGANDLTAVQAAVALRERGFTLGKDVGVLGFDDHSLARENDLTSVRFPLEAMGREAALLALRIASGEAIQHHVRIGCGVIGRSSTIRTANPSNGNA